MALAAAIIAIVLLDQITKYWVRVSLEAYSPNPIIDNILYLTLTKNPGASFGILPDQKILFYIVTFAILAVLLFFYVISSERSRRLTLAIALIMGGAIGNFIDRAVFGEVTDFIDFKFWPVFNVADIAIVTGFLLFALLLAIGGEKKDKTGDSDNNDDSGPRIPSLVGDGPVAGSGSGHTDSEGSVTEQN